jgi:hypothetical protein
MRIQFIINSKRIVLTNHVNKTCSFGQLKINHSDFFILQSLSDLFSVPAQHADRTVDEYA